MKFSRLLLFLCIPLFFAWTITPSSSMGLAGVSAAANAVTWTPLNSGTTNFLNTIYFFDPLHGWATGGTNTLLKTVDGGNNWIPLSIPGVQPGDGYNGVRFVDANTGWVSGIKVVLRTTDGGVNWFGFRDSSSSVSRGSSFPISASTIWVGGAIGTNPTHFRYTFNPDNSITTEYWTTFFTIGLVNDLYFVNANEGWSVGWSGVITHITNASGSTPSFAGQISNSSQNLNGIQMLNSSEGWVVGNAGTILHTANGGVTWTPKDSETTSDLFGVFFIDSEHGWVDGANGVILGTSDGGDTWQPELSGTSSHFRSVFFSQPDAGYAAGQNGVILKRGEELSSVNLYLPVLLR